MGTIVRLTEAETLMPTDEAGTDTDADGEPDARRVRPRKKPSAGAGKKPPADEDAELSVYVRNLLSTIGAVILIAFLLVAVSGVWPPLVAIESESMSPNIETGDMVFVMAQERFPGADAHHGVVTARTGKQTGYVSFGGPGDVILFEPDGESHRTPVIHRAMFWVDAGENWYDRADSNARGTADDCTALPNCPAPHSGFVTKGDFNGKYDQVTATSTVVRPQWVIGTGEVRIPYLGWGHLRSVAHVSISNLSR